MSPMLESGSLVAGSDQTYPIEVVRGYPAENFTGQEEVTRSPASRCGHASTHDLPSPPLSPFDRCWKAPRMLPPS